MTRSIRRATPRDRSGIEHVTRSAYQPWIGKVGGRPAPMDEDYGTSIAAGDVYLAVDQEITGVLVMHTQADALLIRSIAVAPAHQGRGVGTQLLRYAEAAAQTLRLETIRLYTHERMRSNVAWYQRKGFVVEATEQLEVGLLIHMHKSLRKDAEQADTRVSRRSEWA